MLSDTMVWGGGDGEDDLGFGVVEVGKMKCSWYYSKANGRSGVSLLFVAFCWSGGSLVCLLAFRE